ncbi:MAG: hypothetical protein PHS84_12665 [Paludibacter sp.]|nr:hypothetical protein [Paludibacter sp.]
MRITSQPIFRRGYKISVTCPGAEIHKKVESGNLEEAEKAVLWFKRAFGDDLYIELQRPSQRIYPCPLGFTLKCSLCLT